MTQVRWLKTSQGAWHAFNEARKNADVELLSSRF